MRFLFAFGLVFAFVSLTTFSAWAVHLARSFAPLRADLYRALDALSHVEGVEHELEAGGDLARLEERALAGAAFTAAPEDPAYGPGTFAACAASREAFAAARRAEATGPPEAIARAREGVVRALVEVTKALAGSQQRLRERLAAKWRSLNVLVALSLALSTAVLGLTLLARARRHRAERLARDLLASLEREDQARREAEEANEAKSRFLARISHEIRTPLHGILGMAQALEGADLRPEDREAARVLRRSGEHLLDIVNGLLDLARIEAGRIDLAEEAFDPGALLRETGAMVGGMARGRPVEVRCEAEGLPPRVRGDPVRLRQVLLNLAGNAVKYTERGEVVLEAAREDGRIRFCVRDTGPGIAPEDLPRLLRPFERLEPGPARRYGGTGLGLPISKEIVQRMGGELQVESAPGRGASFRFSIPLPEAAAAPPPAAPAAAPPAPRGRVLVVDDQPVNHAVLRALLRRLGWEAAEAHSGEAAVEAVARGGISIVLMDVLMPGMDGYEAARRIRALGGEAGGVPVVSVSASAAEEDRRRALDAGMAATLAKPVRLEDLRATLERLALSSPA